jgi:drug/metabolite transporter (DMT)-like permease
LEQIFKNKSSLELNPQKRLPSATTTLSVVFMKKFNYRIFSLFLIIVLSWGLAWPINKIGLLYMSALWYTAARLIIGSAVMMLLIIILKKFTWPEARDIPLILVIGWLQIGIYILLTNIGLAYLPAGRSSLLAYTTPLWVMPIATIFFHEKSGVLGWLGFLIAVSGLIILMSPWELNWSDTNVIIGTGALLLASLAWAISMFGVRHMRWTKSALQLIPWQLIAGAIPVIIFAWIKEPAPIIVWNQPLIASLIYTGILVTGISYWLGVVINQALPPVLLSLGFLVVPIISLATSAIFMHETINLPTIIAASLILLGLAIVVREK